MREHTHCELCAAELTLANPGYRFTECGDDTTDQYRICKDCATTQDRCGFDNCRTHTNDLITIADTWPLRKICSPCAYDQYYFCSSCEQWFTGLYSDDACINCYSCQCWEYDCEDCYPDGHDEDEDHDNDSPYIHDYSYQPDLRFHTAEGNTYYPDLTTQTPYLGMELEISISDPHTGAQIVTQAAPDLIYCKDDSSIHPRGFEMVTHPGTLEALKNELPFQTLRQLRNDYNASAYNNGIHVHVSRNGFQNDLHVFKWLKLIYRNQEHVSRIARRNSDEWASFSNSTSKKHKLYARKRREQEESYAERYSAINVQNPETFEMRVFRGSLRKDEILAALELVHASVEYTRHLTTHQILKEDGWSWQSFIAYACQQGDTYENLLQLNARTETETKHEPHGISEQFTFTTSMPYAEIEAYINNTPAETLRYITERQNA